MDMCVCLSVCLSAYLSVVCAVQTPWQQGRYQATPGLLETLHVPCPSQFEKLPHAPHILQSSRETAAALGSKTAGTVM